MASTAGRFLRFAPKFLVGAAATGTLSVYAVVKATPEVPTVPKDSLLAAHRATPAYADVFQMHMPLPSPGQVPSIDAFASAFERCFCFYLERKILFGLGHAEPGRTDAGQPLPAAGSRARYSMGQPVSAFWTVDGLVRDPTTLGMGEVRMAYDDPLGVGSTWLQVEPVEDPRRVRLLFGSSLDSSKSGKSVAEMPRVVIEFHRLYSRLLLVNAAGQLWWDLRREAASK